MAFTVDNLEIEVQSNAESASNSIDALVGSLTRLKKSCENGAGLKGLSDSLRRITNMTNGSALKGFKNLTDSATKVKTDIKGATNAVKDYTQAIKKASQTALSNPIQNAPSGSMSNKPTSVTNSPNVNTPTPTTPNVDTSGIDNLKDSLDNSRNSANDLDVSLKVVSVTASNRSGFKGFVDGIKSAINGIREARQQSKGLSGAFGKLLSSMKRIAFYRAIRTVFSSIVQGAKEGLTNLREYSKAINDTDSAMNNSTMQQYADTLLYVKNSVASAIAPMLQALLPTIQRVAHWFVEATNAVNQFISALQGKSTFTKAKEYTQDTSDGLKEAVGSAKELNKQLQGFDELNNLTTNQGGGGGGASVPATDYTEMFEEAKIDSKIKDLTDKFKGILDFAKDIGLAMLGWSVSQSLIDMVLGKDSQLSKIAKGAIGVVIGVSLGFKGGEHIGKGETLVGIIESALGTAIAGIGGLSIAKAVGVSGALGFGIGASIAVVATFVGYVVGLRESYLKACEDAFDESILGQAQAEWQRKNEEHWQTHLDITAKIDSITGEIDDDTKANFELAQKLIDEIFSIDSKKNKTASELELLKSKVKTLNSLGIDGLKLTFDEAKGKIVETKDEVQNLYNKVFEEYRLEALRSGYIEAYKLQFEAEQNLNDITADYNEELDRQNEANDVLKQAQKELAEYERQFSEKVKGNTSDLARNSSQVLENQQQYKDLKAKVDSAKIGYDKITKSVNSAKSQMEEANKTLEDAKKKCTNLENGINSLADTTNDAKSSVTDLIKEWKKFNNMNIAPKTATIDIQATINGAQASGVIRTEVLKNQDLNGNGIIGAYNGGTIPKSHLFFANEDGNPEYIGNLGGTTAVANSDQMGQAIENASYRGMAKALAENGGSITLQVEGDPNGMFRVIQKQASSYAKSTGRNAFA